MLEWITKIVKRNAKSLPALSLPKFNCYDDYQNYLTERQESRSGNLLFEKNLLSKKQTKFTYRGYCYVCKKSVKFFVDYEYAYEVGGVFMPNWREKLECPRCHLNNRTRASVHIFEQECQPTFASKIYITEQTTPLYRLLNKNFTDVYGSEYLGDSVTYGLCNNKGIRNEDITKLSFPDNQFNFILSFDVFEHIPNYRKALGQCLRCLQPGGMLFFSVPFVIKSQTNVVRAYLSENGEVIHLLPPEYHGNPLTSDGCLCYYHFGWELLNELRQVGFNEAEALLYWSPEFGYLGGEQIIFIATK